MTQMSINEQGAAWGKNVFLKKVSNSYIWKMLSTSISSTQNGHNWVMNYVSFSKLLYIVVGIYHSSH